MYRKTLLSAFLLALAVQSVRGKPSCCCPHTNAQAPCSNPQIAGRSPTFIISDPTKSINVEPSHQRQPCLAKDNVYCVPCSLQDQSRTPNLCHERKSTSTTTTSTTTTTTTTKRPTTTKQPTTTLAPYTTALPKANCANGEIYPSYNGNCDQFLMCRDQVYVLMVCPPGFGFNQQLKSCDWSVNVPACRAK